MGLVSRAGVVPLNLAADIAGAVTRTVADTAGVLQAIAGDDPNDAVTAASRGHVSADYAASLRKDGLKGARLGVLHQAYDTPTLDREVDEVFRGALGELRNLGAEVIDPVAPVMVDALDATRAPGGRCNQFKHDLNRYLADLGGEGKSTAIVTRPAATSCERTMVSTSVLGNVGRGKLLLRLMARSSS